MLYDITKHFKDSFYNQNNKSYLFCRLPYQGIVKFTVIGMFISSIETNTYIINRFLVFDIVINPLREEVNVFKVQKVVAESKNQNNSTENRENKDLFPYTKPIVSNNENFILDLGDIEGTYAKPIQNEIDPLVNNTPHLNFNFIKREDQNYGYYPDNYYPVELNSFTQNTDTSINSSSQTIQFTNLEEGENIHLYVLCEVLGKIKQEGFQVEIIR